MFESKEHPARLLARVQDSIVDDPDTLNEIITDVLDEYKDRVEAYSAGKIGLLGFFVGQVMRRVHGNANPKQIQLLVSEALARITS